MLTFQEKPSFGKHWNGSSGHLQSVDLTDKFINSKLLKGNKLHIIENQIIRENKPRLEGLFKFLYKSEQNRNYLPNFEAS